MTHNPLILTVSYLLYTSILVHSLMALVLTRHNRESRPVKYAYSRPEANSPWSSRNMGILGTVLLVFIIVHMRTFWYEMHFGSVPMAEYDGKQYKDLYAVVKEAFSQWWYVLLYVASMVAVGFHMAHGFQSGFQSLGIRHPKYTPIIENVGRYFFAVIIPAAFAAMPIYVFLQVHGII